MNSFFLSIANAWQLLGWTMILFLAAGTIVLVGGGALRMALKRANPDIRYSASLAVFAVLAVMPIAISGYLATNLPPLTREARSINPMGERGELTTNSTNDTNKDFNAEIAEFAEASPQRENVLVSREAERVGDERAPASSIDFAAILNQSAAYLPWLWCIGTPLTFLLLATGLIGAERLRNSCQLLNDGPIRTACDELLAALGIGRQVGVAVCKRIATPLLVGVVKPLILLPPAALTGWTTAELEMVLVHELAHVRRWDNAVNLAQRVVESLLFFHPAVWIVSGWVRRDREDCCDAAVIAHTAKPQAYAELLVALASHQPLAGLATSAAMAQHPIAGRIRRILKLEDEPMLVTRKGLLFGVSAVLVAALLVFALPTTDAKEQVSREAERVADERAQTTIPPLQRGEEQTTKNTNDTKEELNAEAAKNPLTEYTVTYNVANALTRYAELFKHLRGVSEFRMTSGNDNQIVVTARRSVHKRVAAFLDNTQRPIIYAEQTEKLLDGRYKFSFLVPWVRAVDDPARRATTEALIKSDMLLKRAVKEMGLLGGVQPSVMEYLRKDLSVHYSPEGHMFVSLVGAKDGEAAVAIYAAPIINEYLKEHLTHLAHNQRDLATKDHQYDLATTDRYGTILPPDRYGTTNPTRQRGEEQTTNPTNSTNQETSPGQPRASATGQRPELNAETTKKAESAEEESNTTDNSVQIAEVYLLGDNEAEIKRWLKTIDELSDTINMFTEDGKEMVVVTGTRKGHEKLQALLESIRGDTTNPTRERGQEQTTKDANDTKKDLATENTEATEKNSKFPTLEEQRAADLAYKLLGVELEKLTPEELKRVNAKGYKGGLRVTVGEREQIQASDLLVGLHAWPTESLRQLNEILRRDDLDQLTPLKFYVIRATHLDQDKEPAELIDGLVTGRIGVDLDAWRAMREPPLQQLVALEKQIQEDLAEKEALLDDSTGKDRARLDAEDRARLDGERAMLDAEIAQLREILQSIGRKIATRTPQKKETISADERLGLLAEGPPQPLKSGAPIRNHYPSQQSHGPVLTAQPVLQETTPDPGPPLEQPLMDPGPTHLDSPTAQPRYNPESSKQRTPLLYDGKTFDEWRSLWKSELKTEKRIECIKALAAFGRAGKGKEAAEAILDVAGEYDFAMDNPAYIEDNAVGKLKESILEVLTNYGNHLAEQDWLPVLQQRLAKEPAKYRRFAAQALPRLFTNNASVKPILSELQQNEDQAIRQAALSTIVMSQEVYTDDEKNQLIQSVLAEEPVTAIKVLDQRLLNYVSIEQAVEFLLHKDAQVQLAARRAMRLFFDERKGSELADELLTNLNSAVSLPDQLAAIRALAALRSQAKAAEPALTKIIESTDSEDLMIAAVCARERVTLERNHSRTGISEETKDAIKKSNRWSAYLSDDSKLKEAFWTEAKEVTGEQQIMGGGGMGGGMGGGGMF